MEMDSVMDEFLRDMIGAEQAQNQGNVLPTQ